MPHSDDWTDWWLQRQEEARFSTFCIYCGDVIADSRRLAAAECEQCVHKHWRATRVDFQMWAYQRLTEPFTYWNPFKLAAQLINIEAERPNEQQQ